MKGNEEKKRSRGGNNTSTYRKEKRVIWNYVNESKKEETEKRGLREGVG